MKIPDFDQTCPDGHTTIIGERVRIICMDRESPMSIVALVGKYNEVRCYYSGGYTDHRLREQGFIFEWDLTNKVTAPCEK